MRTNKWAIAGASTVLTLGIAAGAFAHGNKKTDSVPRPNRGISISISGEGQADLKNVIVTGVSGSTITVKAWNIPWTINTSSDTRFERAHGSNSKITEVSIGDRIDVKGSTSETVIGVITAKKIHDRSITSTSIKGVVKSISGTTFVIDRNNVDTDAADDITVKTDANTKFTINGAAKAFSDIAAGITVWVKGVFNTDAKTDTATSIRINANVNAAH